MSKLLADQVYSTLKEEIISCAWMPGQQINQAQLAEKYSSGLTPVREALQRLVQEGYVQAIPRFGYIVSPVTISDVREIYELRHVLESAAVRLAILRASDLQLNQLSEEVHFTYRHGDRDSYHQFLIKNAAFHDRIASFSQNSRLMANIHKTLEELRRVFHLGLDLRDSAEEMYHEHLELVKAMTARDVSLAERIVRDQIFRSEERVLEALTRATSTDFSNPFSQNVLISPPKPLSEN